MPTWDQRLPHPDIAHHFSRTKSCCFIKLVDALRAPSTGIRAKNRSASWIVANSGTLNGRSM